MTADAKWYWHPLRHNLRQTFYNTLWDSLTKYQFYLDPDAVEAARAFCLFTTYASNDRGTGGPSQLSLATLEACLAEETAVQPFSNGSPTERSLLAMS